MKKPPAEKVELPRGGEAVPSDHAPRADHEDFAARRSIAALMRLAEEGDVRALHALHGQVEAITAFFNERHPTFASSVKEWPAMVPRRKELRAPVLKQMAEIRIGGVKGGGNGRSDDLSGDSQKGFALYVMDLVEFVRALVLSIGEDDLRGDCRESFSQTGVEQCSEELFQKLSQLPPYSPASRDLWIEVGRDLLMQNRKLVPDKIEASTNSVTYESDGKGVMKKRVDPQARGLGLQGILKKALAKVETLPR